MFDFHKRKSHGPKSLNEFKDKYLKLDGFLVQDFC